MKNNYNDITNPRLPNDYYWLKLKEIYDETSTYSDNIKSLSSKMLDGSYSLCNFKSKADGKLSGVLSFEDWDLLSRIENTAKKISVSLDKISYLQNTVKEYASSYYKEDFNVTRYESISTIHEKIYDLPLLTLKELLEDLNIDLNSIKEKNISQKLENVDINKKNKLGAILVSLYVNHQAIKKNIDDYTQSFIYPIINLSEEFNVHARFAITSNLGIERLSKEEQEILNNKKNY
ncbi:MAG: hypothetical protein E7184_03435 [Erysipelotrichaceae bacterium]|nr:hypothetical protein [Erysipelotrichaceae bacterium]